MGEGANRLARVFENRMKQLNDKPPVLDFGTILDDMSLLTNKFPVPIPYTDYVICRSVCYDPTIPLSMTWWRDEGWSSQSEPVDWQDQHWTRNGQPEQYKDRWGELLSPSGETLWKEKHTKPDESNHIYAAGEGNRTLMASLEGWRSTTELHLRNAQGRNRTPHTRIFSPLLYQLSYLGVRCII